MDLFSDSEITFPKCANLDCYFFEKEHPECCRVSHTEDCRSYISANKNPNPLASIVSLLRYGRKNNGPWSLHEFPSDTDDDFIEYLRIWFKNNP